MEIPPKVVGEAIVTKKLAPRAALDRLSRPRGLPRRPSLVVQSGGSECGVMGAASYPEEMFVCPGARSYQEPHIRTLLGLKRSPSE